VNRAAISAAKITQAAAVQASGWGERFQFFQPRNPACWVYLAGTAFGAFTLVQYYASGGAIYHPALFTGTFLFAIYLVPWLLFLRRQNRFTAQPAKLLAAAFLWGATAATFWVAVSANTAQLEIWAKLLGPTWSTQWGVGLTAAIDEETAKGLGLLLLLGMAPRLVRGAYDGFLIGAFLGLGFEISEDILYAYQGGQATFGVAQTQVAWQTFVARGVTGIVTHAVWSAVFCAGIMWILGRNRTDRRILGGLLALFLPVFFHFAYDDAPALVGGNPYYYLGFLLALGIASLVTLVVVRRLASRQERVWIRDVLAPEYAGGVVDAPLLAAFSGVGKDRRRYRKLLHSRRRARHLVAAAGDLAREIAHARGAESDRVVFARREVRRLRSAHPGSVPGPLLGPGLPPAPGPVPGLGTLPGPGPAPGREAVSS
jgi:RsiW-degrading membrane proteinase PrsW (M82 family)